MNKKTTFFLIFKIIGFLFIILSIFGFILSARGFGDFETNNFMIGAVLGTVGLFIGITCLMIGFRSELTKIAIKSAKHIQEENKEDLKDIADTSAEITGDAVKVTTKNIKEGLKEETIYCKHCGLLIDADSIFCSQCGKKQ